MKPRALFVCSSRFHTEMFSALAAEAGDALHLVAVVDDRLPDATMPIGASRAPSDSFGLSGSARFARRSDRAHAAEALLRASDARALVLGNDVAPLERALAHAARRAGWPVVLLQDGLFPAWATARWRVATARAAVGMGASDLAPTVYGAGEATHVGALGEAWRRPLGERSSADVAIVGNPAFARVLGEARARAEHDWRKQLSLGDRPLATFFTTNVLHGLGRADPVRHARQLANVRAMREAVAALGWQFAVRPHPAEDLSDYGDLGSSTRFLARDVPLATVLGASRAGFVAGTVVALLLSWLGRATIWPTVLAPASDERAAAAWLRIPMAVDVQHALTAGARIADEHVAALLHYDADERASTRLIMRALDLK